MALKPPPTPADPNGHDPRGIDPGHSRHFAVHSHDSLNARDSAHSFASSAFALIVAEFTACWERGEPTRVEAFLDRMESPHPADVVELIYREFCLAETLGMEPNPSDFLRRFPERGESLERLFRLHGALSSGELRRLTDPGVLPEIGDEIGPYTLRRELGRGSFARVFLAEQADLDDRLVVVKISTQLTPEPRLLARARHAHIVEVFWHGTAEDGALQLICMPFLGGASLAAVLAERRRTGSRPRRGRDLLAHLDGVSAAEYPKANLSRPAREVIQDLSYSAALAWMVARLAEALDHAYERGVAHGDVKPSNILVTADGNPMLLDFNLAVGWRLPGGADLTADAGGTLAYMAPERLKVVAGSQKLLTPRAADRHRADVFSLGIVLLEALTGREPDLPQARARARHEIARMFKESAETEGAAIRWLARSSVPPGLRSILARCLAPDPADRYGRAAELAEDLDRWRTDRPLAFASEPPRYARVARWARRRKQAIAALAIALAVGGAVLFAGWTSFNASLRDSAEDKLASIWDRSDSGALPTRVYGHWDVEGQGDPVKAALKQLNNYRVVEEAGWRDRVDIRTLPEPERSELELWLLEQVYRYARALGDRPDSPDDWQRAIAILDRELSHVALGPFLTERRRLADRLGRSDAAASPNTDSAITPPGWMEEYLSGIELEPAHAKLALEHFETVVNDRPESFWGHYRAAAAAYRLSDHALAAEHLKACIRQRPDNASLRAHLAACLSQLGLYDRALDETNKALAIDPDHAMSTRNRTYVRGHLGQVDSLVADFRRFVLLSGNRSEVSGLGLNLNNRLPEAILASIDANVPGRSGKESPFEANPDTLILRAIQLRNANRCDEALLELDRAIDLAPDHLPARYHRAMLLRTLHRPEAEGDFAYLVENPRIDELIPQFKKGVTVYAQRVRDLLDAGRSDEAIPVAREGVVQANRFNSMQGEAHYALARAYAVAAPTQPELFPLIIDELKAAGEYSGEFLTRRFEHDRFFEALRTRIQPLLHTNH